MALSASCLLSVPVQLLGQDTVRHELIVNGSKQLNSQGSLPAS